MKTSWLVAFGMAMGLMLLLESIIPFLFPRRWRNTLDRIIQLSDGQIRFLGLIALIGGLASLALVNFYS